ncbi:hypothetical protein [Nitrosomonas nitrosa]|nr:hypothetical protein [Nitrosomonas nitrosa]
MRDEPFRGLRPWLIESMLSIFNDLALLSQITPVMAGSHNL